jgi:hypothetical protein
MLAANGNGTAGYTGWAVVISDDGCPGACVENGNGGQETVLLGPDAVCTGGWVHVAATWDSGTPSVYAACSTTSPSGTPPSAPPTSPPSPPTAAAASAFPRPSPRAGTGRSSRPPPRGVR